MRKDGKYEEHFVDEMIKEMDLNRGLGSHQILK